MLTLQTGSVLSGNALGSTAAGATNNLILQGNGRADNNFVGFQSLDVQANGAWFLNGNASVGAAAINGGLVVGDANHASANLTGDVTINGALAGQGTITGNIRVMGGGVVDTANLNSFSTLHVTGNATFQDLSIFIVKVNAGGQASKLDVGGTATLSGGSVKVMAGGTFAPSTQYTILTAAGGVTGSFIGGVQPISPFSRPH